MPSYEQGLLVSSLYLLAWAMDKADTWRKDYKLGLKIRRVEWYECHATTCDGAPSFHRSPDLQRNASNAWSRLLAALLDEVGVPLAPHVSLSVMQAPEGSPGPLFFVL